MPSEVIVINNLPPISFVGGTDQRLEFTVVDSASAVIDLSSSGSYCFWVMGPISNPTNISASGIGTYISGSVDRYYIELVPSDTENLGGVYIQQPIVVDGNGKFYIPGQGKVTIFPRNQT